MRMSIQAELDTFFAHLRQQAQLVHEVSAIKFCMRVDNTNRPPRAPYRTRDCCEILNKR